MFMDFAILNGCRARFEGGLNLSCQDLVGTVTNMTSSRRAAPTSVQTLCSSEESFFPADIAKGKMVFAGAVTVWGGLLNALLVLFFLSYKGDGAVIIR